MQPGVRKLRPGWCVGGVALACHAVHCPPATAPLHQSPEAPDQLAWTESSTQPWGRLGTWYSAKAPESVVCLLGVSCWTGRRECSKQSAEDLESLDCNSDEKQIFMCLGIYKDCAKFHWGFNKTSLTQQLRGRRPWGKSSETGCWLSQVECQAWGYIVALRLGPVPSWVILDISYRRALVFW